MWWKTLFKHCRCMATIFISMVAFMSKEETLNKRKWNLPWNIWRILKSRWMLHSTGTCIDFWSTCMASHLHWSFSYCQSWTVIFPEGTCFAPNEYDLIKKSNKAADDNGVKPLVNHLTPRYRGSFLALEKLRSNLDAIYDVTCVYSGSLDSNKERTPAPELIGKDFFQLSSPFG